VFQRQSSRLLDEGFAGTAPPQKRSIHGATWRGILRADAPSQKAARVVEWSDDQIEEKPNGR
jgi:hypothetical protein